MMPAAVTAIDPGDADIQAATPPLTAVFAGRVSLALGVFTILLGAQSLSNLRFASWIIVIPIVMLPLGLAALVSGWQLSRARGWAAITCTVLAAFDLFLTMAWTVLALTFGYFSMLSVIVGMSAFLVLLLAVLSIGACQRADQARARLSAQGFDLGV
jgi:bacteriorhodopsin